MKNNNKNTLTFNQLKKLMNESTNLNTISEKAYAFLNARYDLFQTVSEMFKVGQKIEFNNSLNQNISDKGFSIGTIIETNVGKNSCSLIVQPTDSRRTFEIDFLDQNVIKKISNGFLKI